MSRRSSSTEGTVTRRRGRPAKAAVAEAPAATPEVTPSPTVEERAAAKEERRVAKELAKAEAFYAKYPHVVRGSFRESTPEDMAVLKNVHGYVCLIQCECGNTRLINTQDAFQVHKCLACAKGTKAKIAKLEAALAEARAAETQAVAS